MHIYDIIIVLNIYVMNKEFTSTALTDGVIPGRTAHQVDYCVEYFAGQKADQGIQFPATGEFLDPEGQYRHKAIHTLERLWGQLQDHPKVLAGEQLFIGDIGAGPGHNAYWAKKLGYPFTFFDFDISESLLRSEYNNAPGRSAVALIDQLPVRKEALDVVIMSDVLEHVEPEKALAALENAREILTEDGLIFVNMPNRITWSNAAYYDQGHLWLPSPKEIDNILRLAGYQEDTISVTTRGFPYISPFLVKHFGFDPTLPAGGRSILATAKK